MPKTSNLALGKLHRLIAEISEHVEGSYNSIAAEIDMFGEHDDDPSKLMRKAARRDLVMAFQMITSVLASETIGNDAALGYQRDQLVNMVKDTFAAEFQLRHPVLPVEELKVGDRVMIVSEDDAWDGEAGTIVANIYSLNTFDFTVRREVRETDVWYYRADELRKIDEV